MKNPEKIQKNPKIHQKSQKFKTFKTGQKI